MASTFILYSIALTTPLNIGGCVTNYRHCVEIVTWMALRQPPYILTCRSILLTDHRSHFSYLLPHHFYLLRVYIQSLQSHIYNQVVYAILYTAKLTGSIVIILSYSNTITIFPIDAHRRLSLNFSITQLLTIYYIYKQSIRGLYILKVKREIYKYKLVVLINCLFQ